MTDIAVRVESLSKQYRIGARQAGYRTIRETMTDLATAPLRRLRRLGQPSPENETIWALKDVSFDVKKGEVVGIIGRNGAGKTTLLKILCRITEPTEGHAEIQGRVGSLLEVGTGFHPELTGRENIYLNGAILGMKRGEIDARFDQIVAFSEIEKFLDTPVKRYSSGMYVRLAFAVAAHLEPEILLVDEVLAVGDASFQKKCLGKMGDVAREGRTVLFVSHNLGAVEALCSTCMVLTEGHAEEFQSAREAIRTYLGGRASDGVAQLRTGDFAGPLKNVIEFYSVEVMGRDNGPQGVLSPSEPIRMRAEFKVHEPVLGFRTTFSVFARQVRLLSLHDSRVGKTLYPGHYAAMVEIPAYFLRPGEYSIALGGYRDGMVDYIWGTDLLHFQVAETWDEYNDAMNIGLVNVPRSGYGRTFTGSRGKTQE